MRLLKHIGKTTVRSSMFSLLQSALFLLCLFRTGSGDSGASDKTVSIIYSIFVHPFLLNPVVLYNILSAGDDKYVLQTIPKQAQTNDIHNLITCLQVKSNFSTSHVISIF